MKKIWNIASNIENEMSCCGNPTENYNVTIDFSISRDDFNKIQNKICKKSNNTNEAFIIYFNELSKRMKKDLKNDPS
tara:strand:+ start:415 stop:645 length:231 start_codon:yes stop_codon:yes gene_type:complete